MLQNGFNTGPWSRRRGEHSAISNAEMKRLLPAPIYGSPEVGEVSTDLLNREGWELSYERQTASRRSVENKDVRDLHYADAALFF